MKNYSTEAQIITQSVSLQQGLSALLESLPGISSVNSVKDLASSTLWIESHHPRIVLLDIALSRSDPRDYLERVKVLSPETQRILLVDQVAEMRWVPQYAEAILIKGAPATDVATIVTNLLSLKGEEHEHNDLQR
jgi:DNA-binding NarL/FixJ family response regulator